MTPVLSWVSKVFQRLTRPNFRPPGALAEDRFIAACIKCGRCMQVCPYRSIRLASPLDGVLAGTPVIDPLAMPCYLCMKCPPVCPTPALNGNVKKEEVRMGLAKVVEKTCLGFNGIVCRVCYRACPLMGKAVDLNDELQPMISKDYCVGCGLCLYVCPTEPKSIDLKSFMA